MVSNVKKWGRFRLAFANALVRILSPQLWFFDGSIGSPSAEPSESASVGEAGANVALLESESSLGHPEKETPAMDRASRRMAEQESDPKLRSAWPGRYLPILVILVVGCSGYLYYQQKALRAELDEALESAHMANMTIDVLRERIDELESEIDSIKSNAEDLEGKLDELDSKADDLESRVSDIEP